MSLDIYLTAPKRCPHCNNDLPEVESYPDATHAEYETHLADALRDIVELDRAADAADAGIEPAGVIFTNEPPIGEPEAVRRKVYVAAALREPTEPSRELVEALYRLRVTLATREQRAAFRAVERIVHRTPERAAPVGERHG